MGYNLHYEKFQDGSVKCIENEIPFELPEGWAWCRLGFIGNWQSGATPNRRHHEYYGGEIPWLKTGDLNDDYINSVPEYITEEGMKNSSVNLNPVGSVLIAMYGSTIGRLGIANIELTTNQACCACLPIYIKSRFLFYFLMYQKEYFIKQAVGGAQPNISKEKIVSTLFPVPPINEQEKLLLKLDELFKLVTNIEIDKNSLFEIISTTKSKILDLAIRGKLVPQDSNDEPASVLLERIRTEKEKLIKQGKIKRDKKESIIFRGDDNSYFEKIGNDTFDITDSIPFEIPDTWIWCRLKCVASNEDNSFVDGPFGSDLKTIHYTEKEEVRIIQLNNIGEEGWKDAGKKYTTFLHAKNIERCISFPEDIVIAKMMPAGRTIILPFVNSMYVISSDCIRLRADYRINKNYLVFMLNSPSINKCVLDTVQGIGRTRTSLNKMKDILIPVPPESEQKKISKLITILFDYLNSILNSL